MAAGKVAGAAHFAQQRCLSAAAVFSELTPQMKIAALWRCSRARHFALEDGTSDGDTRIRNWDARSGATMVLKGVLRISR